MAGAVANLDMKGCFMTKGFENFIPLVAKKTRNGKDSRKED